jgi:hypothetical protein
MTNVSLHLPDLLILEDLYIMYFFTAPVDKLLIESNIERAKALAGASEQSYKDLFLTQLRARISDFESDLASDKLSQEEKEQVLAQYDRFAKALIHCMTKPQAASSSIKYYFNQYYYPVGILDTQKPEPVLHSLAIGAAITGFTLLFSAIPAFIINPVFGASLMALAISMLLPGCFFLCTPDSPDTSKKKDQEKTLLQRSAQLIDPAITFDPEPAYKESSVSVRFV